MKKILPFLFVLFYAFAYAQPAVEAPSDLTGLDKKEWARVDRILSYKTADSVSKITPIEVLRYLISDNVKGDSNIKQVSYKFPRSWMSQDEVGKLMPFIASTKKARQIQSSLSSFALPRYSTLGYEAMHLINLFKYNNYNYPSLCFLFESKKSQEDMAKDFTAWWGN